MILDISPRVDYAFKHTFGRESTRPLLIDVTNSVLTPSPGHLIDDLFLLNPFNPKESLDDKLSILDIKAKDQSGRQLNLEMQMLATPYYEKRILYYAARLHQLQLHEGEDYVNLKPTISISFLDHMLFPKMPGYHWRFRLLEETSHFPLTDDLEFHIIELPKFTKSISELQHGLDFWLYFFRNAEKIDTEAIPDELKKYPPVILALEELKMLAQTDVERERYESRRKAQLDDKTRINVARMEGRTEGLVNMIHFCERMLRQPETPVEQLATLSLTDLTRLADELQKLLLVQA